jgi:DNA-directed RNA polymerase I, II, and III subunit RPABC2
MAEFRYEEEGDEEEQEFEEEEELDIAEGADAEQIRTDTADLQKLYKQHPEIWISYEDDIAAQLPTHASGDVPEASEPITLGLREQRHLDKAHRTYPFLSQYERTKCISFRASQIGHGAKPYVEVPRGMTDSYLIAKMEQEAKRLPYIIKRTLPDGSIEVWRLADLAIF